MYPTILEFGSLAVRSYGVALAAAVLVTVWCVEREAKKKGVEGYKIFDLAVMILLVSILGARLMYVVEHWSSYYHNPLRIFMVWEGGLTFLGGLIPGIVVGLLYLRLRGLWFLRDTIALYLPIGIGITRIGCFLNGCCFGKPTDLPLGVEFPVSCAAGAEFLGISIHPTQLYSSLAAFLIFAGLKWMRKAQLSEGTLFWSFLALYSFFRFFVDWVRYYEPAAYLSYLTVNQWLSVVIGVVSAVQLIRLRLLNKR
jgi:phosphatidylglycerol:prolipoprotein diacylglycerol transferase